MADVSKIKLGSTTYNIKDSNAALKTEAIKNITRSGTTFTVTRTDNTTFTFTQQDSNTTYPNATDTTGGVITDAQAKKLAGIESGAQVNTVTGIKGNSESTYRTGNVNITAANVGAAAASHNHAASEITSGTLDTARIPDLNTSKLTAGTLGVARGGTGASTLGAGVVYHSASGTGALSIASAANLVSAIGNNAVNRATSDADGNNIANTYAKKTDISGVYKYKGSVVSASNLPNSNQTIGDVYNIETSSVYGGAGMNVAWDGETWDPLGEIFTVSTATDTKGGILTDAQAVKLAGIASGAEVNQNAFSNVVVGSTTIAADAKTDSITLAAGSNITLTPDATNDKITIAATNTTYSAMSESEAKTGTATTARSITAAVLNAAITNKGYTTNTGTVTSVATGVGLTGGTITGTGTVKAKLKSETAHTADSATPTNTANRQYAVGVDKSGYLSVNVPWENTAQNQNAFSNVVVGSTTIAADTTTDTIEFVAGSNITLTPDATNDKVTIAATNTTYSANTGIKLNGTTFQHTNSVTAGTAGTSSATSGSTLAVPYVTYDAQGHITGSGTHTHTISGFLTSSSSLDASKVSGTVSSAAKLTWNTLA